MKASSHQVSGDKTRTMRRFLIGQLPEDSRERLEKDFFASDGDFELLLALEDDLMYEYLQDKLDPAEREAFERHFLSLEGGREKLQFAKALADEAAEHRRRPIRIRQAASWRVAVYLAAAAALLLAVALPIRLAYQTSQLRIAVAQLQQDRSVLEKQVADQAPANRPAPVLVSLILAPGLVRGSAQPAQLRISESAAQLRLQLDLRRSSGYQTYRVFVRTAEGVDVWSQDLPPSGRSLVLTIPASIIRPGEYRLSVKGATPNGFEDDADYFFSAVH
jgi:hypothetical protein